MEYMVRPYQKGEEQYVADAYRGHGVGAALTAALLERVQQVENTTWSLDGQTVYEVRMDKELV